MNQWNLQQALYTRLTNTAPLQSFVGQRIYDDVPQDTVFPYVVIGDDTSIAWDQDCMNGSESTITLHVWSRYSGRKEVKQILQTIYNAMHNQTLTIAGSYNVICQADYQESFLDPDGVTRHGVIRFRLLTSNT